MYSKRDGNSAAPAGTGETGRHVVPLDKRRERVIRQSQLVFGEPFNPRETFHFVTVMPNALRRNRTLTPGEKIAVLTVSSFISTYGECYASRPTLAREMGAANDKQAKRWLDGAVEKGLLRKTERPPTDGKLKWDTNVYELLWHPILAAGDDTITQGSRDKLPPGVGTIRLQGGDKLPCKQRHPKQNVVLKESVAVSVYQPANHQKHDLPAGSNVLEGGGESEPTSPTRKLVEASLGPHDERQWLKLFDELKQIAPCLDDRGIAESLYIPVKHAPHAPRTRKWFKSALSMTLQEQRERALPPSVPRTFIPGETVDVDGLATAFDTTPPLKQE
jgi:hypothetical protein